VNPRAGAGQARRVAEVARPEHGAGVPCKREALAVFEPM
jgi:hypothetical protein